MACFGFHFSSDKSVAFRDAYFCALQKARELYLHCLDLQDPLETVGDQDLDTFRLFAVVRPQRRGSQKCAEKKRRLAGGRAAEGGEADL